MADEEKKYLITAEAQVQNAMTELGRLEAAIQRLGEAERRMASSTSPANNITGQSQARVDAINKEVAAYENLNRVRQQGQGGLTDTKQSTQTTTNATTEAQTVIKTLEQQAEAYRRVTKERYGAEGLTSTTIKETNDLKAQRLQGLQYTDISRTIGASGNEKVVATTYKEIGGAIREVNSAVSENGKRVSETSTAYTKMSDGIYQADRTTKQFTDTAQKGVGTLEHLSRRVAFMAEWFAFYAIIQLVQKGLQSWNQAQIALSDEMANFDIVTRGSNVSAETYLATVDKISKATGINPEEIGPGVTAQMRVFNAPSDLALRAAQVQRVTGVDNAQVQREIMGLRLQFPDRTTIGILDAFSGALKRSSLSASELFGLLETAGPLSQQFNTGLEQILGMMAGLSTVTSESGQAVELYMRQMDRLYSDPRTRAKVEEFTGKPVVGTDLTTGQEVRRPLYDVMADIAKLDQAQVQEIANTIPNALGQKTRQLFVAMVNGWANVEDATKSAMGAQGEFLSQNERKMQTYQAAIDGLEASWQRLLRGMEGTGGAIAGLRELSLFLDNISESLNKLGNSDVSIGQRAGASLKTSSIWGLLYSLAEDTWSGGAAPSPRAQRQMANNASSVMNSSGGWSRTVNDMSDPTKVGTTAWANVVNIPETVIPIEGLSKEMTQAYLDARLKIVEAIQATPTTSFVNPQAASMGITQLSGGMSRTRAKPLDTPGLGDANIITRALKIYEDSINKQITDMILASSAPGVAQSPVARQTYRAKIEGEATTNTYYDKASGSLITLTGNTDRLNEAFAQAAAEVDIFYAKIRESAAPSMLRLSPDGTPAGLWGGKTPEDYKIPKQKFELPKGLDIDEVLSRAQSLQNKAVTEYRGAYPEATAGRADAEVMALSGAATGATAIIDSMGNIVGTTNINLSLLGAAASSASAALAGLSFVSPPEGVSLGAYGAASERYAAQYEKTLDKYGDPSTRGERRLQVMADETGTYATKGKYSDQALAMGNAAASKYYSAALSASQQANALLKQISDGVSSFAENLLKPTSVTEGDMALAKTGGYKDKWDEPVRRIQDVMDRRKGMNPDLGPWAGFAGEMGIDMSSIESTIASGEQFKSKFYSGQMSPDFYDKYSKEGFLASAKEELAAQQGKERLTGQAVGWLKESGMDKDVSKFIGRKLTGDVTPIEEMLYGGKDPSKVGKDIEASAKPIGDGLVKGVGAAFTFEAMYSALEAGWKLKDAEAQKKIMGLGNQVGALLTSGAATSFGDQFLDAVIAAVLSRLDKEYM